MSDIAVRVEALSKQYRIGGRQEGYKTFRESLTDALQSPVRRLGALLRGTNGRGQDPEDTFWALKDISFEVRKGEVVGIIGRNGAGKSTLLKVLSRITEPTSGLAEIRGRVGSLLEVGTGFHPELTGRENIFLNGAILGMRKAEIARRFDEIVAFSEVEKFIDTPVKRYSSGMYLRLAFAVAAHLEPEILLVDEVLAVGDAAFQKKCLGKMGEVKQEGRTVIFVSHNMGAIMQLCPRVIWIESGQIEGQGDTRAIISRYFCDNNIPMGVVAIDSSEAKGRAKLKEIYLMDEDHNIRPDIDYDRSFYIVVRYEVMSRVDGLLLGLKVHNEQNVVAVHTATCDWPETVEGIKGEEGCYLAYVKIPAATLTPGRYYCSEIGLWSPNFGHHHHVIGSVFAFHISGGNLRTVGNEVLRPRWMWRIERNFE
jgi:lipopolysaccharide transport system ATP-binding protein